MGEDHPTESQFIKALNKKRFGDLTNEKLRDFIVLLNNDSPPDDDCIIECHKTRNVSPHSDYKSIVGHRRQKPKNDVQIEFNQRTMKISLKSGQGNSAHQNKWSMFEKLLNILDATPEEIKAFDNFIHSRDTKYFENCGEECIDLDFTKTHPEFNNDHESQKKLMQGFLDRKKKQLLEHVLKRGYCSEEGYAEYIFHGGKDDILSEISFGKIDSIIDEIIKSKSKKRNGGLYLGIATFQRWNVTNKSKLDSMQIKINGLMRFLK